MTRSAKFSFGLACLATALVAAVGLTSRQAEAQEICCAGPPPDDLTDNSIAFEGDPTLRIINSTSTGNISISGNIGIANGDAFFGSGTGTVTGTVMFAGPIGVGQFITQNGFTVTGGATPNNSNVTADLIQINMLSATLKGEQGTAVTITGTPGFNSVNASSGILDSAGNRVFTGTIGHFTPEVGGPVSTFTAGTSFTISGSSTDRVVINIPTTDGLGFDGSIVLDGITPDHVLFNFDAGDYANGTALLTGGDTLSIDTEGNLTSGIFLDPNGNFEITNSMIHGRIFGGGSENDSFIETTNAAFSTNITAPPPFATPEPTSLVLLGAGLAAFGLIRRRHRPLARP